MPYSSMYTTEIPQSVPMRTCPSLMHGHRLPMNDPVQCSSSVFVSTESAPPPPPAMPPGAPPPPPAPGAPPPPPPFGLGKKIMAVVLSMFDKARQYRPKKRMKKMNWEKVCMCIIFFNIIIGSFPYGIMGYFRPNFQYHSKADPNSPPIYPIMP